MTDRLWQRISQRGGGSRRVFRRRSRYDRLLDSYLWFQVKVGLDVVVMAETLQQLYVLFSVPYRIGFLLDPYSNSTPKSSTWWISTWLLSVGDIIAYLFAIGSLLHTLADRRKLSQVKPRTIDVISMMRHSSNAQAAIVKFSMNRQESLRRRSSFMRKEASMKPEYVLSSSWDAARAILKSQVALQLVSMLPFQLLCLYTPNLLHVACLPTLLRLEKLPRVARAVKRALAEHEWLRGFHNAGMALLAACVLLNLASIHWSTSLFMFINHLECGYMGDDCGIGTSWATKNGIVGAFTGAATRAERDHRPKLLHTYVYALVVVGYGFPVPETNLERIFVILMQFTRFLGGVGVISAFVFLFECQNRRRNHFSDKVDDIKGFLSAKHVSNEIKDKVLDFYEHFWAAQRGIEEDLIVASLPSHIQTMCLNHLRVRLLKSVPIIRGQPVHILNRLIFAMRRQSYTPRDWILHDERCEHLYLMCRGRIAILHAKSDNVQSYILDGQYFGLSMLVLEDKSTLRARAETYCDLYTLTHQDIYDVCLRWDPKNVTFDAMVDGVREYLGVPARLPLTHVTATKFLPQDAWYLPSSAFRKYWEWGIMVSLLYFAIDIPYRICFESIDALFNPYVFAVSTFLDVFLFTDIVFRSRYFAFVHDDRIVVDRRSIFRHYKDNGMVLDFVSNLPFALVDDCLTHEFKVANPEVLLVLHLCEWVRFLRMRHLLPTITRVLKKLHVDDTTFVIVYLFFCMPIVCHIGSCLWYLLATWDSADISTNWTPANLTRIDCLAMARQFNNCTWLLYDNVEFGASSNYLRAFYWSVVGLVTIQFGSIFPFTTVECLYMFGWLFVGSITNYGAIGALVNAVTRINAATQAKDEHLMLVHRFMHAEGPPGVENKAHAVVGVSRRVRRDVSSYFKHRWTQSSEQQLVKALQPLPDNLRQAIQSYLHAKAVSYIQLLQDVDKNDLKHIFAIMAHRSYKKDEVLVRAGEVGDELYVITRGAVELSLPINGVPMPVLVIHEGGCIGEAQFLPRTPYPLTATVVSPSIDVSVFNRFDFDSISKHLEASMEDIEAQSVRVGQKEIAWLASTRKNLDRRKIRHSMHRANSKGLFADPSARLRLVDPSMNAYRAWEVVILIVVLYNFIAMAFRMAFLLEPTPETMFVLCVLDYTSDALFFIDMCIKFNHLTYSDRNGDQVTEPRLIRWHYVQHGSFKLDALSSLPLYYVGDYKLMTLCRLPRLLRCFKLGELWGDISLYIHEHVSTEHIAEYLEFVKLLTILVLASHLAGTGLYFVSTTEVAQSTHMDEGHMEHIWYIGDHVIEHAHDSQSVVYLRAFYWGLGVLSSFDYIDIEVALLAETVWFCAVAITGVLFLGIVIGQTSTTIYNASKDSRELEMRIERFGVYASTQKLPKYLVERGKLFFRFQHDCNKGVDPHEIFGDLPHTLRLDLFKDLYTTWVRNVPYFSGLQPGTLRPLAFLLTHAVAQIFSIAEKLRLELYLPGDDIVLEGDVATHFFIMKRGRGEKYLKTHMLVVAPVDEGVVFGEDAFFLDMRYTYCVRAVKCSEVLCLPLTEWEGLWPHETRVEIEWRIKKEVQTDVASMKRAIHAITRNLGVAPGVKAAPVKIKALILKDIHVSSGWNVALNFARQQASSAVIDLRPSITGGLVNHTLVNLVRLHQEQLAQQPTPPPAAKSDSFTKRSMGSFIGGKKARHEELGVSIQRTHPALPLEELSIWHRDPPPHASWVPHSRFRELWDLFCLLITLYFAFALPFRAVFVLEWSPVVLIWFALEYCLDAFCLVDMVLRFNYFYEFKAGELQVTRALVRQRYWTHGGLVADLLAAVPLEVLALIVEPPAGAAWQVASLLRLNKLARIVHYPMLTSTLRRFLARFPRTRHHALFAKFTTSFLVPFFVAAHWMACTWFFNAYNLLAPTASPSWLVARGYVDATSRQPLSDGPSINLLLSERVPFTSLNVYVSSLYFATSSLTSQSLGDVVSTNVPETWLSVGAIVFSIAFYGLLTGVLSGLIEENLKARSTFEQKMVDISTFYNYRRLPFQFFIQTSRFFRSLWQRSEGRTEYEFLAALSPKMKEDIAMHVKRSMVLSISFLATAHEVFVRALVTVLETEQFVYADLIYQVGDVARVLYFINLGGATVLAAKKTPLEKFQGSLFGGRALFQDQGREYTAIANCDCECFLLYFDDFDALMERFPEYFDKCRDEWMYTERELDEEAEKADQDEGSQGHITRRESTGAPSPRRTTTTTHSRTSVGRRGSSSHSSAAAFSMMGD
ncbi:Voltage-gated Ion Channel (VIC) Superfamily [Achlya hypogyna]|uniref:Voltage-gated Ion Channel (VIC) Superfamily n=1 Tax=Achlya hypogyna TaxID=1202772 RepID=A0A1V9ZR32_ACHHY|nr:Voltage-gated Ion Channel (VIC) Superfamily [Achlya hypogyna]